MYFSRTTNWPMSPKLDPRLLLDLGVEKPQLNQNRKVQSKKWFALSKIITRLKHISVQYHLSCMHHLYAPSAHHRALFLEKKRALALYSSHDGCIRSFSRIRSS